jgi:hypothetical protein
MSDKYRALACESCGSPREVILRGDVPYWRCPVCGTEVLGAVVDYFEGERRPKAMIQVNLWIVWPEQGPTVGQVAVARRLFTSLAERPIRQMRDEAARSSLTFAGKFFEGKATELANELRKVGLESQIDRLVSSENGANSGGNG